MKRVVLTGASLRSRCRASREACVVAIFDAMPSASIDDIEAGLPNGLHDSRLHTFSSAGADRRAEFVLDVWVGDLHSTVQKERERYRRARLELLGLGYLIVEDPDPRYGPAEKSPVQCDICAA